MTVLCPGVFKVCKFAQQFIFFTFTHLKCLSVNVRLLLVGVLTAQSEMAALLPSSSYSTVTNLKYIKKGCKTISHDRVHLCKYNQVVFL